MLVLFVNLVGEDSGLPSKNEFNSVMFRNGVDKESMLEPFKIVLIQKCKQRALCVVLLCNKMEQKKKKQQGKPSNKKSAPPTF